MELNQLVDRIAKQQNITLSFEREAVKFLTEKSYDPAQGARFIRRNIQELIEDNLAEKIITGEITEMSEVKVSVSENKVVIKQIELARA